MLHLELNRNDIKPRLSGKAPSRAPYLVKVELDPAQEFVLSERFYKGDVYGVHLLPCSNGQMTLIVEHQDGRCAKWEGDSLDDGTWVSAASITGRQSHP